MTLREEAIFVNGIYESVLEEILSVQRHMPEHIMFLQPFSALTITHLRDNPPSFDDRVRLLMSITNDLAHIHYTAEIVGWDNKQELAPERAAVLNRLLWTLQPNEGGLYHIHSDEQRQSVNLLHIWRLQQLRTPIPVSELTVISTGQAHKMGRTTAGGWSYVVNSCLG